MKNILIEKYKNFFWLVCKSKTMSSTEVDWYGAGGRFRNKIYVGNLSSRTKESDIRQSFNKYGQVVDVVLKYDFAFVEFENEKDIQSAIELIHFFIFVSFFSFSHFFSSILIFFFFFFF